MTWTNDYESLETEFKVWTSKKMKAIILKAFINARIQFGYEHSMEDFVVIRVNGFNCIALVTNEFTPIEICPLVFPYDENKTYPMQEIEQRICFKTH